MIMGTHGFPAFMYIGAGTFVLFVTFITLYISRRKCQRCEKSFFKNQLRKCNNCDEFICSNCLDQNSGLCNKCKTKHELDMTKIKEGKPEQQQSQQVVVQAPTIEVKHCINCGEKIKFEAAFCDKCGIPQ